MRAALPVPALVSGEIATGLRTALRVTPRLPQPGDDAREAAVLILLTQASPVPADAVQGLSVVLVRKAPHLRTHAGQVAFPGGRREAADASASDTAVREAAEEVGLSAAGVDVVAELPQLGLGPSNHRVTPVLAWWRSPSVLVADGEEVVEAAALPLSRLADPANRVSVRHPRSDTTWPGYDVPGYDVPGYDVPGGGPRWFVWGFTGWLVTALLTAAGADVPWDASRAVDIPPELL